MARQIRGWKSRSKTFRVFILMAYGDEIGLYRAIVRIVPYHPKWAEYFRREKELLLKMMGETALDIRHIGSTTIVGMPAKPILDILVAVQTLAAVEPFVEDLKLIGYEDRGNGDEPGRRYFVNDWVSWRVATRKLSLAATWMNRRLFVEVILACNRSKERNA